MKVSEEQFSRNHTGRPPGKLKYQLNWFLKTPISAVYPPSVAVILSFKRYYVDNF